MPKLYLILFFIALTQCSKAQNVLYEKMPLGLPKLNIDIKIFAKVFRTSDSIKVQVNISNPMLYTQKIVYKGSKYSPLETWFNVSDEHGKSVTEVANKNVLSSYMYTQKELEKKGAFISISPLQTLTQTYYLKDVLVFNYKDYNTVSAGTYNLVVKYYDNNSNKVYFKIIK
jgi:hypothetical protein